MTTVPAAGGHPAPPDHPERPQGASLIPPWPGWTAPAALFAGFAAALVAGLMIALVGAIFGADLQDAPPAVSIASVIAQDACLIGAAILFARLVAPPRPGLFGLRRAPIGRSAAYLVGGYVVFVLASYAWLQLIGEPDAKDTITEDLGAKDSTVALVAVTFVVTVCAPLAEEFFFRGYFFGALRSNGFWPAALLTGLAFGIVHVFGSPIAFIVPLALLGAGLCFLREKTGSLYPGIALHCLNNSVAMSSSEHWSWQVPVVLVLAPACIALFIWLGLRFWPQTGGPAAPTVADAPAG
ncbi:MAG TPA: CPBP family intramembrane glutamic endopeptidase [Baekduia sp.]|nr:CPBP family intramembrane glutamic endopeptidase [Baekduia sp.]